MESDSHSKKPYVIINCAASADGKIALPDRRQTRISSEADMARVHRLRNECDAILVGITTVINEDPKLTVKERYLEGGVAPRQPLRVVLDSKCRTPKNALVVNDAAKTLIATAGHYENIYGDNVEVLDCGLENDVAGNAPGTMKKTQIDLGRLLAELYKRGIKKLMVEGGETVIWSFLESGFADELRIYIGPLVIGGTTSPTIAGGKGAKSLDETVRLELVSHESDKENGLLIIWKIKDDDPLKK